MERVPANVFLFGPEAGGRKNPLKLFLSLKAFDVYEGARKVGYGEVLSS